MAQDRTYHGLADRRTLLGIPNAMDVLSNLPFLVVGVLGLWRTAGLPSSVSRASWIVFCGGVTLVSAGSAWYHLAPTNSTLLWDRLPIAAAFMGLFSLVVADRVSPRFGQLMLWPAVAAALGAVLWWHFGETRGSGDLRPYVLVQGIPLLLIPLILVLCRKGVLLASYMWCTLAAYGLAKATEGFDHQIFHTTGGLMSGHTIKHLLAALAVLFAIQAFTGRRRGNASPTLPESSGNLIDVLKRPPRCFRKTGHGRGFAHMGAS